MTSRANRRLQQRIRGLEIRLQLLNEPEYREPLGDEWQDEVRRTQARLEELRVQLAKAA